MARRSSGSRKKVTAETLVGLGAERLAEILADVADTRVDLKRRLRMELAAQEGPGPLTVEIDKRLSAFETSRGQITWHQRPAFIRDLDALRDLIVARLAPLDASAATERLWRFMGAAEQSYRRYRERNGELEAVFERAARRPRRPSSADGGGPGVGDFGGGRHQQPIGMEGLVACLAPPDAESPGRRCASGHERTARGRRRGGSPWCASWPTPQKTSTPMPRPMKRRRPDAPHVAVELARRYLACGPCRPRLARF